MKKISEPLAFEKYAAFNFYLKAKQLVKQVGGGVVAGLKPLFKFSYFGELQRYKSRETSKMNPHLPVT